MSPSWSKLQTRTALSSHRTRIGFNLTWEVWRFLSTPTTHGWIRLPTRGQSCGRCDCWRVKVSMELLGADWTWFEQLRMFMADKEFRGNVTASAPTGVLVLFDHLTIGSRMMPSQRLNAFLLILQRCLQNCISDIFPTLFSTHGQYSLNFINISSVFYHFSMISLWCHGWHTLKLYGWHPEVLDPFIVTLSSPRRSAIPCPKQYNMVKIHINWYQSLLIFVWSWCFFGGHFVERCWNIFEDLQDLHADMSLTSWRGASKSSTIILDRGAKSSSWPFTRPVSVGRHTSVSWIQLGLIRYGDGI